MRASLVLVLLSEYDQYQIETSQCLKNRFLMVTMIEGTTGDLLLVSTGRSARCYCGGGLATCVIITVKLYLTVAEVLLAVSRFFWKKLC